MPFDWDLLLKVEVKLGLHAANCLRFRRERVPLFNNRASQYNYFSANYVETQSLAMSQRLWLCSLLLLLAVHSIDCRSLSINHPPPPPPPPINIADVLALEVFSQPEHAALVVSVLLCSLASEIVLQ